MGDVQTWLFDQGPGLVVLGLVAAAFIMEYIVTGRTYRRALEQIERQQSVIEGLSDSVRALSDHAELTLDMVRGIDDALQQRERER